MQLASGTRLGNYVVESVIADGGMATLYRVKHAVLGTACALKVLSPSHREQAEVRARFLDEGIIAARLQHPNLVRVFDVVATEEVAGLVMELIEGPTLADYVKGRATPPSAHEVRAIFLPVLSAMGEAHTNGIVHRDLKPANILLQNAASGFIPKVTDFGIAKVMAGGALVEKKGATSVKARMGTLGYMSPEQVRGAHEVTPQSDIFSLGATLYELVTGKIAFDGDSDFDVMQRIVQGEFPRLVGRPGVDPAIAAAVDKALEPSPSNRFRSCDEFAAALRGEVSTQPPREPTGKVARDADGAARPSTDSPAAAPPARPASPNKSEPAPSGPPRGSSQKLAAAVTVIGLAGGGLFLLLSGARGGDRVQLAAVGQQVAPSGVLQEALRDYQRTLDAWDQWDEPTYWTGYKDPMDCYFNKRSMPLDEVKVRRHKHFELRTGTPSSSRIVSLHQGADEVVFFHDDASVRRLVKMVKLGGRWLISGEADKDAHKCLSGYF